MIPSRTNVLSTAPANAHALPFLSHISAILAYLSLCDTHHQRLIVIIQALLVFDLFPCWREALRKRGPRINLGRRQTVQRLPTFYACGAVVRGALRRTGGRWFDLALMAPQAINLIGVGASPYDPDVSRAEASPPRHHSILCELEHISYPFPRWVSTGNKLRPEVILGRRCAASYTAWSSGIRCQMMNNTLSSPLPEHGTSSSVIENSQPRSSQEMGSHIARKAKGGQDAL
ncbi:hypothetical protein KIN20_008198 [Parelaphostrongylus tenuis]|uniref:Uncharacterized protein n=1 Tax=Parelaphostrongylus tenuis TaxID=148309 RepID=A0AAD5MMG8_PARTN|nr:hypothetical protein KIN20_008198 [Parelaphostrongylus tenuis]